MDFFIKESNIRGGNRGGKNLFNWNDVRLLSSRDRQSYLGSTQALGLMDRGGKWYKRDWWTHYNTPINVYGQKDKLNNREALLEEQKEIRLKEKEKLNEFIYGKKKKNTNLFLNSDEILSHHGSIKLEKLDNKSTKKDFDNLSRPGLGMIKIINKEKDNNEGKEKNQIETEILNKIKKNNEKDDPDKIKYNNRHHHHHHHHHRRHHMDANKRKSRHRERSRSKSRSKSRKKSSSKTSEN